jgi:AcrR family transcriptional regulator
MERKSIDEKKKRQPSGAAVMRADLTDALCRALFEEWAEMGYAAISLERVAARAGAGKAAIYRRWPSKQDFATEAIERLSPKLTGEIDQGTLSADLEAYLLSLRRGLRHRLVRRILPDMYAERARSGELSVALDKLAVFRRQRGMDLLDRAIGRGELRADIDREFALDLIPSPLYWRMIIHGRRVSRGEIRVQVIALLAALRAGGQGSER